MFSEEIKPTTFQRQTMYSCSQGHTKDLSRSNNAVFKIRLCRLRFKPKKPIPAVLQKNTSI